MLLFALLSAVLAGVVGPDMLYAAPSPTPVAPAAPLRDVLRDNVKSLALAASAALIGIVVVACALSSDACVRRRINRGRKVPIAVDISPDNE